MTKDQLTEKIKGRVCHLITSQQGSKFLQSTLYKLTDDQRELISNELLQSDLVELMSDDYANYFL